MASSLPALLAAIERGNGVPTKRRSARVLVGALVALMVLVLLAAFLGSSSYGLWQAWQSANWSSAILNSSCGILPLVCFLILLPVFVSARRNAARVKPDDLARNAKLLRDLAATEDEQIVPVAALQPAPLGAGELSGEPLRISPLKRPLTSPNRGATTLTVLFSTLVFIFLFAFMPILAAPGVSFGLGSSLSSLFPVLVVLGIVLALVPMFVGLAVWARRRTFSVSADARGVRWQRQKQRGVGQEAFLPWTSVRGLVRIAGAAPTDVLGSSTYLGWGTTYLLVGPDLVLIWIVAPSTNAAEAAASEALLRLSATYTGKPLRDLSVAARELAQARGSGTSAWFTRTLSGQAASPASLSELSQLMQQGQKPRRNSVWVIASLATIFLIALAALPIGASTWLQNYQSQYFAMLPAHIHAEQPLFADSLQQFDDEWPVGKPSATSCGTRYLAGTAYEIYDTTTGNSCNAYTAQVYGDVAVEVTASEFGQTSQRYDRRRRADVTRERG